MIWLLFQHVRCRLAKYTGSHRRIFQVSHDGHFSSSQLKKNCSTWPQSTTSRDREIKVSSSSERERPAARAAKGKRLFSVIPGIVFVSNK
jgi:hypothetical protein